MIYDQSADKFTLISYKRSEKVLIKTPLLLLLLYWVGIANKNECNVYIASNHQRQLPHNKNNTIIIESNKSERDSFLMFFVSLSIFLRMSSDWLSIFDEWKECDVVAGDIELITNMIKLWRELRDLMLPHSKLKSINWDCDDNFDSHTILVIVTIKSRYRSPELQWNSCGELGN